jgi:hypothetical protein
LTIRPSEGQSSTADTRDLVAFLASLRELRQTGPISFEAASGQPWVSLILARTGPTGGYPTDGQFEPQINIVELVCSCSGGTGWYDSLAARIAEFLGWEAVEEHEDRKVWPAE